jgi:4-amino-4-deoxy-L-arabinose transferase-like glycosyltransferase
MALHHLQEQEIHKKLRVLIGMAVLVNLSGLFVPLMDPDAGIYASIAKNMVQRNDYVNLWVHEKDWLDKPHLPFWVTALFFKIFGFHGWVYKLPAILCSLLGARYTYLFARKFYSKTTGLLAAFILLTSFHFIISNNDVRAEPFLTGFIIAAIYYFSKTISKPAGIDLLLAAFFTACAVMTKGIFTIIPIGGAVGIHLLMKQEWKEIFHYRWVLAFLLIAFFITPELYCLYQQFDLHPEKVVFGKTNVSGIKFFLWDSQFGRFFGNGPIANTEKGGDPTFFLHTLLWAFLPWCLLMYASLFTVLKNAFQKKQVVEWFTAGSILATLLIFSFSGFQLPAYTNILFPMMAVMTAYFIILQMNNSKKSWAVVQNVVSVLLLVAAAGILYLYRPQTSVLVIVLLVAGLLLLFLLPRLLANAKEWIPYVRSGGAAIVVFVFLNLSFYPDLLQYQSGNQVAWYINKNYPATPSAQLSLYIPSARFYLKPEMRYTSVEEIASGKLKTPLLLVVNDEELQQLQKEKIKYQEVKRFDDFHVTQLTGKFVNYKTRKETLASRYLLLLNGVN